MVTYCVRNYQYGKERRVDLNDLGVVVFASRQQLGLLHDEKIAKALNKVSGVYVVRSQSSQNMGIPDLEIVGARVPIVTQCKKIPVQLEDGFIVAIEPEEVVKEEIVSNSEDESELPFCGCGCEKRVTHKGNKFLRGHHFRGRKKSEGDDKKLIQN